MIYSKTVTSTNSKTEATLSRENFPVTRGLVYFWELYLPPGSGGLLHIRVLDGSYCVFPASPSESFRGNAVDLRYEDLYLKETEPFQFTIEHWNEDDMYDHSFTLNVGMVSERTFKARYLPTIANEDFKAMLESLGKEKEEVAEAQAHWGFSMLGKVRES